MTFRAIALGSDKGPARRRWADFLGLTKPRVVLIVLDTVRF